METEKGPVEHSKYSHLKRLYFDAISSRDDANNALHRAQRQMIRLRNERNLLLDRIRALQNGEPIKFDSFATLPPVSPSNIHDPAYARKNSKYLLDELDSSNKPTTTATTTTTTNNNNNGTTTGSTGTIKLKLKQSNKSSTSSNASSSVGPTTTANTNNNVVDDDLDTTVADYDAGAVSDMSVEQEDTMEPYFNEAGDFIDPSQQQTTTNTSGRKKTSVTSRQSDGVSSTTNSANPSSTTTTRMAPMATRPKRVKSHTVTRKTHAIPQIKRDEHGQPILPLTCGIMTLYKLGQINNSQNFYTERYIFPVGYEVSRSYNSMIDPNECTTYTCRILDGGDNTPRFEIEPQDQPGTKIIAGTATGAWAQVFKTANRIRQRVHSNSVSGPDYYGLGQPVIKALVQELPGADQLAEYVMQDFVESQKPEKGAAAAAAAAAAANTSVNSNTNNNNADTSMDVDDYEPSKRKKKRPNPRQSSGGGNNNNNSNRRKSSQQAQSQSQSQSQPTSTQPEDEVPTTPQQDHPADQSEIASNIDASDPEGTPYLEPSPSPSQQSPSGNSAGPPTTGHHQVTTSTPTSSSTYSNGHLHHQQQQQQHMPPQMNHQQHHSPHSPHPLPPPPGAPHHPHPHSHSHSHHSHHPPPHHPDAYPPPPPQHPQAFSSPPPPHHPSHHPHEYYDRAPPGPAPAPATAPAYGELPHPPPAQHHHHYPPPHQYIPPS